MTHISDLDDPEIRRIIRIRALLKSLTVFLVALIITTMLGMSAYIIWRGTKNTDLLKDTHSTAERIKSCTTPGLKCYEQGKRQTAKAVGTINQVIVLAAFCAHLPGNDTLNEITICVQKGLNP